MSAEPTPEAILAALRVALAPAATADQRAAGAALARALVAQLDPSAPAASVAPSSANAPAAAAIPVASPLPEPQPPNVVGMLQNVLAQLRKLPPEQHAQLRKLAPDLLLEAAIANFRAALQDGATAHARPASAFNPRFVGVPGRS